MLDDEENKYGIIDIEPSTPGHTLDVAKTSEYDTMPKTDLRMPKKVQKTDLKYQKVNES